MARRILDRKKLRAAADAETNKGKEKNVRKVKDVEPKADKAVKAAKTAKAAPVRKVRAKKVKIPPRMRVRWCIYDGGMKPVALFDYNQLPAAKAKLAEYLEKKPSYFLQLVKESFPVPDAEASST